MSITKSSYLFITLTLILTFASGLGTPFLAILFSYLALVNLQHVCKRKVLSVALFSVLVLAVFNGFVYFAKQALQTLPHVVSTSIPVMVEYAKQQGWGNMLPFDDVDSMNSLIVNGVKGELGYLTNFAKVATKEFVAMIIGLVIACSLFIRPELDIDRGNHPISNNLYSRYCDELATRFRNFYGSFSTVMGAQIIISTINTVSTGIFVYAIGLPHATVVIVVTFLCGLLPIIGNLMSNSIIVGIAITVTPKFAVAALGFLVILHKFEYFLNSKIIGGRIKNPMWVTLLALVVGEKLAGIPGMILAPVILHYIKTEARQIDLGTE